VIMEVGRRSGGAAGACVTEVMAENLEGRAAGGWVARAGVWWRGLADGWREQVQWWRGGVWWRGLAGVVARAGEW
jgi:hypothetical protein